MTACTVPLTVRIVNVSAVVSVQIRFPYNDTLLTLVQTNSIPDAQLVYCIAVPSDHIQPSGYSHSAPIQYAVWQVRG